MKKCPFCAEQIQDEAVKCKHCGSAIPPPAAPASMQLKKETGVVGAVILFFGVACAISAIGLLTENWIGPAIVDGAIGAGLIWYAWNRGYVSLACPGCTKKIKGNMKKGDLVCGACGHRVRFRAPQ